jgi:hypothetical protein
MILMRLILKLIYILIFPIYITLGLSFEFIAAGFEALEGKSKFWRSYRISDILKRGVRYFAEKADSLWENPRPVRRSPVERVFDKRPEPYPSRDHHVLSEKLPFGLRTVVYYYDRNTNPLIRGVIDQRLGEIIHTMKSRSVDYFDLHALKELEKESNQTAAQYYLPIGEQLIKQLAQGIQKKLSHREFCDHLGIKEPDGPCFIKCTSQKIDGKYVYKLFFLPESDTEAVDSAISYYLHFITEYSARPQFSVGFRNPPPPGTDPDNDHEDAQRKLDNELKMTIKAELDRNGEKGLINMIQYMCEYFKRDDIHIAQELKQLSNSYVHRTRPSRLLIRRNGVIHLIDYNKEVCLNPLQLTVYLFFIQRPDGIMFKELPKYRDELFRIYAILSNRTDRDTLAKSIDDLANPFSNSMSEKCSRIKEAFIRVMDESWAESYYITGRRNERKRILLSRDLVQLEGEI